MCFKLFLNRSAHVIAHPESVRLCTFWRAGKNACAVITTHSAKLGLVDFDGRPTEAVGQTRRSCGVVQGSYKEVHVINIQYEIKGMQHGGRQHQGESVCWQKSLQKMLCALCLAASL